MFDTTSYSLYQQYEIGIWVELTHDVMNSSLGCLDSSLFFRGTEGGRREGGKTDAAGHAAAREERATRSGLDGKDSRWVGRLFEGPQRNKRGREKRLARPRNNCDIMIQIPFDVLTRRTAHAGGGRGGRRTQQFVVRVQNT